MEKLKFGEQSLEETQQEPIPERHYTSSAPLPIYKRTGSILEAPVAASDNPFTQCPAPEVQLRPRPKEEVSLSVCLELLKLMILKALP